MASPMTPEQLEAQLKRWKIDYAPYKADWKTHNRGNRGNGWSNLHGVIIHHTGTDADARPDLYNGDAELPGPKVQFYVDQKGKVWLIGWGRANHAGGGDPDVLDHVIHEDYEGTLKPHFHEDESGAADGNGYFYGIEIGYSGLHAMMPAQYATVLKLCSAINEFHKWTEKSNIAHGEWSDWKWDPGISKGTMMNMPAFRGDIKSTMKAGPGGSAVPEIDKPDTPTQTTKDVWDNDSAIPPSGRATKENPTWSHDSILRFTADQAQLANVKLDKIMKHLGIS